jgi:membrane protein
MFAEQRACNLSIMQAAVLNHTQSLPANIRMPDIFTRVLTLSRVLSIRRFLNFSRFLFDRFIQDRCLQIAGSLTFSTLLALVPLFAIVVAVLSYLPFFQQLLTSIKIFLLLNLVPDIAYKIITVYMGQFAANARKLTYVGVGFLLFTAISMLYTVDRSFNDIWRSRRTRPWWMSGAAYLMLLVAAPLLLGLGISITSYLVSLSLGVSGRLPYLDEALLKILSVAGSTVTFFLVYRIVPCRHVPLRNALIGAFIAALLFEALKSLFAVYVTLMPGANVVYGAFAAIPVFLLWIFLCWCVILIGAEVSASLPYWGRERWHHAVARPEQRLDFQMGLELLGTLARTRESLQGVTLRDLNLTVAAPLDWLEDTLDHLVMKGVVRRERGLRFRLLAEPQTITLEQAWNWFHDAPAEGMIPLGLEQFAGDFHGTIKERLAQPLHQWLDDRNVEARRKESEESPVRKD